MKIAIEAQRIFRRSKHGMDFVALEVIRRLQKLDHENEYYIFVAPGEDRCLEESDNLHIITLHAPSYPLWEQVALPQAVRRLAPDLLHCTSNTAPICTHVPLVVTLHDIIFLERQSGRNRSLYQKLGRYYRRLVVPQILPRCRRIITVSEFERERIQQSLQLPEGQLVAIHNGVSPHFRPQTDPLPVTRKYLPDERYLFFLGNTDPKKNTAGTLRAYARYRAASQHPLPLLLADLSEAQLDAILSENNLTAIKPSLHVAGYIPNTDLPAIYSAAAAFLYTSLRESFGIPILEAMACGTPVVTSDTSAIPETAGAGALLVDPTDPEAIAAALLHLENDPTLREAQIVYGLQRAARFTWETTARNLLELYREVAAER